MRRIHVCAFVAASIGLPALAAEGGVELSIASRNSAAAASAAPHKNADAPFRAGRDPLPEILLREELDKRGGPRGSCEASASDLCYDMRDGKVVYRRAREYMPRIQGLRAESISVKRSGMTFKYSF